MALFLISYDIAAEHQEDRKILRDMLEQGAWVEIAESAYVVQYTKGDAENFSPN